MSQDSPYITHRQALAGIPVAVTSASLILAAVGQCSVGRADAAAERAEAAASEAADQVLSRAKADSAETRQLIREAENRLSEQMRQYNQQVGDLTKMLLRGEVRPAGGRR